MAAVQQLLYKLTLRNPCYVHIDSASGSDLHVPVFLHVMKGVAKTRLHPVSVWMTVVLAVQSTWQHFRLNRQFMVCCDLFP